MSTVEERLAALEQWRREMAQYEVTGVRTIATLYDPSSKGQVAIYDSANPVAPPPAESGEGGPEWTCTDCGSSGPFKTIRHDTPGEASDFDMRCDSCGSTAVEESPRSAAHQLGDKLDDAKDQIATLRAQLAEVTRERDALGARLVMAEAKTAVIGGEWCASNRREGRGPCGSCSICCADMTKERDAALAREKKLREALKEIRLRTDDALTPHEEAVWDIANAALAPEVKP